MNDKERLESLVNEINRLDIRVKEIIINQVDRLRHSMLKDEDSQSEETKTIMLEILCNSAKLEIIKGLKARNWLEGYISKEE